MARPDLNCFDKLEAFDTVNLELRLFVFPFSNDHRSELIVGAQGDIDSGTGEMDTGELVVLSMMMSRRPFWFRLDFRTALRTVLSGAGVGL